MAYTNDRNRETVEEFRVRVIVETRRNTFEERWDSTLHARRRKSVSRSRWTRYPGLSGYGAETENLAKAIDQFNAVIPLVQPRVASIRVANTLEAIRTKFFGYLNPAEERVLRTVIAGVEERWNRNEEKGEALNVL